MWGGAVFEECLFKFASLGFWFLGLGRGCHVDIWGQVDGIELIRVAPLPLLFCYRLIWRAFQRICVRHYFIFFGIEVSIRPFIVSVASLFA